jgi:cytochrome b6-f complex iron-sulfur subunit
MSNNKNKPQRNFQAEDEPWITRRGFAKLAFGGMGVCYAAAIGYSVYGFLRSPVLKAQTMAAVTEVTLKDVQKLPVGQALIFKFGIEPCLLIHVAPEKWVALSAKCTHLGCTVQYEVAQKRIFCACHGGTYDPETGKNLSGPPPKPLKSYLVKAAGPGELTVTRA